MSDSTKVSNRTKKNEALSHYEDHVAFFYGKISAAIASLVTYFLTTEFIFLATTIAMLAIMLADVGNIRRYRALVEGALGEPEEWRYQYRFLSTAFMLTMGIWCFFCFILSNDAFLHLLCIATTMGNILNLICRNFYDDRTMTLQLCAVGLPLIMGVLAYGDFRSMILCGFFMPLFSSIRDVSHRLRSLFQNVEAESEEKEAFGIQLNEALESMSHGLIMFDEEMRLRVINHTARQILAINEQVNCFGKRLNEIARIIELQKPYVNRIRVLEDALRKRLQLRTQSKIFQMSDKQHVELSIKLRENGGCVLVIEDVSQRIKYQDRINQLARFDDLTGLCNRAYFYQQSESILTSIDKKRRAATIFFDLDDFKRINDMLGHEAGDFILASVAERLREFLPKHAVVGRHGGDEFVIFVEEEHCAEGFEKLSNRLIHHITRPLSYNNQRLRFGASLGVAIYPDDATTIDRLLKLADLALYESKNAGKNRVTFFTADMEDTLQERLQMETDLTKAVKGQNLELHFQPIVSMTTHKPAVFEALTRWNRNGTENVSPAEFIPLAEDLGLIREIGEWTLKEACRQCMLWHPDTSVAVNVSAVQFQVGSITEAVKEALIETGLHPSRLEIEITETAVLNDMDHAILVLEQLSDLGVKISLDDFGTGYSSLSYLHRLPLDKLKIDKSFIDDLIDSEKSQTLLKGITAMGKALDLKLVVEGIEDQSQFDLLKHEYNVDFMQGYFFSKALPAAAAEEFSKTFHAADLPDQSETFEAPNHQVA
ncbi:MAG: EAL domain-containing protein [Pseudomonadota bacterium]